MASDYALVGPPSISLDKFTAVLVAAHSPMAPEAASIYAAVKDKGVDPAVILAIAQHESTFGKAGIAVGRDNPFGSRYYAGIPGATDRGGWAAFTSYTAAASYTAGLLASSKYAGSKNASTAFTFPTVYAPAKDHNDPIRYGTSIVNAINGWTGQPLVGVGRRGSGVSVAAQGAAIRATTAADAASKGSSSSSSKGSSSSSSSSSHLPLILVAGAGAILLVIVKRTVPK